MKGFIIGFLALFFYVIWLSIYVANLEEHVQPLEQVNKSK